MGIGFNPIKSVTNWVDAISFDKVSVIAIVLLFTVVTGCSDSSPNAASAIPPDPTPQSAPIDDHVVPNVRSSAVESAMAMLLSSGYNGTVVLKHKDEVVSEGFGFADREAGLPNGADVVYDIGSMTKQFTSGAIMRLQMDGLLSVEDRIEKFLPELPADKGTITLHQLLSHTAGIRDSFGDDYNLVERDAYIELFANEPLQSSPGVEFAYSNAGYTLLAFVVETASGMGYERYLHDNLFVPAGMYATGYMIPDWNEHTVSVGYIDDQPAGRPHELPWLDDGPGWHLRGNGGMLSTPNDMMRWNEALLGDEILDSNAKSLLYKPHAKVEMEPENEEFSGYGWFLYPTVFDTQVVSTNGGNGIFAGVQMRFLEQDVTVFMQSNAVRTGDIQHMFDLIEAVFGQQAIDLQGVGFAPDQTSSVH